MKWVFIFIFAFAFSSSCFVEAASANVTLIDEIGTFTGAVMKVKSPISGELGEKIFPSENLKNVGILKFEIESSLSEVMLTFITIKSGSEVESFEVGPFSVDGSEIIIDRREVAKNIPLVVVVENDSLDVVENVVEEDVVVENDSLDDVDVSGVVEKNIQEIKESIDGFFYYYVLAGILLVVVLMFFWLKNSNFGNWMTRLNYFSEDGELARIENAIEKKDRLIAEIKEKKDRKKKILIARKRLLEENEKLEKMMKSGESEDDEDFEDKVDKDRKNDKVDKDRKNDNR
jgi:hypothetical protein